MVIEFRGELMRRATADARERRYRAAGRDCYLFNVNEDSVVDATLRGTIGRFTVGSLVCHRMDTTISHICCLFSFTDNTVVDATLHGTIDHCKGCLTSLFLSDMIEVSFTLSHMHLKQVNHIWKLFEPYTALMVVSVGIHS